MASTGLGHPRAILEGRTPTRSLSKRPSDSRIRDSCQKPTFPYFQSEEHAGALEEAKEEVSVEEEAEQAQEVVVMVVLSSAS